MKTVTLPYEDHEKLLKRDEAAQKLLSENYKIIRYNHYGASLYALNDEEVVKEVAEINKVMESYRIEREEFRELAFKRYVELEKIKDSLWYKLFGWML